MVKEPATLTPTPASLTATSDLGRFRASVKLTTSDPDMGIPNPLQIELQPSTPQLQLLRSRQTGDTLEFEFEAHGQGDFTGTLVITEPSSDMTLPCSIPYRFQVRPRYLGLVLAKQLDLGAFPAGVGEVKLPPIPVRSRDAEPATYLLRLTDLSNGTNVIAITASETTISLTNARRATVDLEADILDLPPGRYTGTATFVLRDSPRRTWDIALQLVVTDTLTADELDFGTVEPGAIRQGTLTVRNHGGPLQGLATAAEPVQADGGLIELVLPDRLPTIDANGTIAVPVKLSVSPLVTSRGNRQVTIRLRRPNGTETDVPVRFTIADARPASSPIIVTPDQVRATAEAGSVVQFKLSIKLGPGNTSNDQLDVETKPFTAGDGTPTGLSPAFRWPSGNALTTNGRAILHGFLVAPDTPGEYHGKISIKSRNSGVKTVNATLVVQ
jgi:hypothetical protein